MRPPHLELPIRTHLPLTGSPAIDAGDAAGCFFSDQLGHRIWESPILELLASGATLQEFLYDHPGIVEADIQACLAFGAEMARERYVDVPLEPAASCSSSMKTSVCVAS